MRGVWLPGGRVVDVHEAPDPEPGPGQVLVAPRASTICGSDLRAIYREHLGAGPEAYAGVIAGHEPAGEVVAVGAGVPDLQLGDRVVVYHISGCGHCAECRRGYAISCTSPHRQAYGWQRDGGHAELLLAEAADLLVLPDSLSYLDGACVACGFGTAYEALRRIDVGGADEVLVTGLGPVGLATGLLARALGARVVGTDPQEQRRAFAEKVGAVDAAVPADGLPDVLRSGADAAVDCSGAGAAQTLAIDSLRRWGRMAFVGEGATLTLDVSAQVIHRQLTLVGSWVISTWRMAELLDRLDRWQLHPHDVVTDRFPLDQADGAYRLADGADGAPAVGKVAIEPQPSTQTRRPA
jgi:threonine dehydrogenase-like Zn-dependent dehydrogenase